MVWWPGMSRPATRKPAETAGGGRTQGDWAAEKEGFLLASNLLTFSSCDILYVHESITYESDLSTASSIRYDLSLPIIRFNVFCRLVVTVSKQKNIPTAETTEKQRAVLKESDERRLIFKTNQ